MPVVAFVPLTILWAGTGDGQKFLIIWIGTFFQQVLDGDGQCEARAARLRRVWGGHWGCRNRRILLRIVLPSVAAGHLGHAADQHRVGLDVARVGRTGGRHLGARLPDHGLAALSSRHETIIGYILFLGLLGLVTDQGMKAGERVLFRYAARP